MTVARRRLIQTLTAGACARPAAAQDGAGQLKAAASFHELPFSEERLRVLRPILERRRAQLQALRALAIDDAVAPAGGIRIK